jgi:RNA polymerase sigma-70 factor, ECF subfamily
MHLLPQIPEVPVSEERRFVSEVLRKDRKTTAEFVSRCADWAYPLVRRRLTPRTEMMEDLMQEIVLAAWQNLSDYRGEAGLRSWVLAIARHKIDDYYRKRIREAEVEDDDAPMSEPAVSPLLDEHMILATQRAIIDRTLARIPEAYALVLLWRYRDEKSLRDMAEVTGKTEKAVERLLARARENFRRRWNDDQP